MPDISTTPHALLEAQSTPHGDMDGDHQALTHRSGGHADKDMVELAAVAAAAPDQEPAAGKPDDDQVDKMANFYTIASTYLSFTLSDSALRMAVLFELYSRKFTPIELAIMFSLYEVFGVVTNLFGGIMGSRLGLRPLLLAGLVFQIVGISMLYGLDPAWSKVATTAFVAVAQGFSGVAKDLVKMSGKSVTKLVSKSDVASASGPSLLKLVAYLTGAKNSIKGLGYFFGALLVTWGFTPALTVLLVLTVLVLAASARYVAPQLGKSKTRLTLLGVLRKQNPMIRRLSLARLFLFGSRDLWFDVPLPVFLRGVLHWPYFTTGAFLAGWVIMYGSVQSAAPHLVKRVGMDPHSPRPLLPTLAALVVVSSVLAGVLYATNGAVVSTSVVLVIGLLVFAAFFAVASSLHSYLIVAYSNRDKVAANVGIYYCANAMGRLIGTLASGYLYSDYNLSTCLWCSVAFLVVSNAVNVFLAHPDDAKHQDAPVVEQVANADPENREDEALVVEGKSDTPGQS
ncbi:major facilitator transporter [Allomyces macrogynus ATCC 38327]|uniref:Major facilitator transporter n=1 Tax=Allomyces macrogynus (strain ATCC 38327) TaxID=578462 RepID=A0A0L0S0W5_ALLM3|nr:major facilitator transporter [Allomyces macrogynus ATCC 38327]|eukprot:KNE55989.1 major facilitator transporter [Allomyces macrogynus ATCC 38327]